jgi:parvulin-like peptidyl-prolyl isomerase
VVAKVNGEILTNAEISDLVYQNAKAQGLLTPQKPNLTVKEQEVLAKSAVHSLVRAILIKQTAERLGKSVAEEEVSAYLKGQGMEDSELTRRIAEGVLLFDQIMMAEGVIIRQPSPKAIRSFYRNNLNRFTIDRQVIARQIIIPKATAETRVIELSQANRYRRELQREGNTFRSVAARRCSTPDARKREGLIAIKGTENDQFFFVPNHPALKPYFPEAVLKALETLPVKTVREPIETDTAFHLLYIERERPAKKVDFEGAIKDIERHLFVRNRIREQRRWLLRVMGRSHITWHDDTPVNPEDIMPVMPAFELRQASGF